MSEAELRASWTSFANEQRIGEEIGGYALLSFLLEVPVCMFPYLLGISLSHFPFSRRKISTIVLIYFLSFSHPPNHINPPTQKKS